MREQLSLFSREEIPFEWEKEWQGMPEFSMENKEPVQRIIISFRDFEDVKKFGELMGQKVTSKTDSLWFPKDENYEAPKNYLYVSDEP